MSHAYRDEKESLHAKLEHLEKELADHRRRSSSSRRAVIAAGTFSVAGFLAGALFARAEAVRPAHAAEPGAGGDACEELGVRMTVDGADVFVPAADPHDLAGHKYRRDGSRSPWFTVDGGPLYVHGVGDFLPGDVGRAKLSLLTIRSKGESDGYTLARGGRSLLEVSGSDGKRIRGHFEADVSKVTDTTREPAFGTPVVRVRGRFCLPALPASPQDTGP